MAHLITFRTTRFDPAKESPNPTNPIAGQGVLGWLRQELNQTGYRCSEPATEDWGWYVDVEGQSGTYLVGASGDADGTGTDIEWAIQIHKHRSLREKLLGRNQLEPDDALSAEIERLVRSDASHHEISVDRQA